MAKTEFSKPRTLAEEIKRDGGDPITSVKLRAPNSGDLGRNMSLTKLQMQEVGAVSDLIRRISYPALTASEIENLKLIDFVALSAEVLGFLFSEDEIAEAMASL